MFHIDNARFCNWSKWKILSSNTLERMQIWNRKTKMENLINDDLEPRSSDDETENDSNSESDNESDNE